MDKKTYLEELETLLKDIQEEDKEDALHYVEEYFDEAGIENEAKVNEELGSPSKYAKQIKASAIVKEVKEESQESGEKKIFGVKSVWYIVVGICALPIAFPLVIAALAMIFALSVTAAVLVFAAIILCISFLITSIPLLVSSFSLFSSDIASGFMALGASISMLGASLLLIGIVLLVLLHFAPWATKKISNLYLKLKGESQDEK